MQFLCDAWERVCRWWYPEEPCVVEPLDPKCPIMDPPPTLAELEHELTQGEKQMFSRRAPDLAKVMYFYKPKSKLP